MHHRVTRKARARRRSGGQKRPSGAFLERGRVPDGAPEKTATIVAVSACRKRSPKGGIFLVKQREIWYNKYGQ